jgi:hypothetical protein
MIKHICTIVIVALLFASCNKKGAEGTAENSDSTAVTVAAPVETEMMTGNWTLVNKESVGDSKQMDTDEQIMELRSDHTALLKTKFCQYSGTWYTLSGMRGKFVNDCLVIEGDQGSNRCFWYDKAYFDLISYNEKEMVLIDNNNRVKLYFGKN